MKSHRLNSDVWKQLVICCVTALVLGSVARDSGEDNIEASESEWQVETANEYVYMALLQPQIAWKAEHTYLMFLIIQGHAH